MLKITLTIKIKITLKYIKITLTFFNNEKRETSLPPSKQVLLYHANQANLILCI